MLFSSYRVGLGASSAGRTGSCLPDEKPLAVCGAVSASRCYSKKICRNTDTYLLIISRADEILRRFYYGKIVQTLLHKTHFGARRHDGSCRYLVAVIPYGSHLPCRHIYQNIAGVHCNGAHRLPLRLARLDACRGTRRYNTGHAFRRRFVADSAHQGVHRCNVRSVPA